MKTYIYLVLTLALMCASTSSMQGQTAKKEHKTTMSTGTLSIIDLDDVLVEGYNGSEVVVSSMVAESEENERAKGLKLMNAMGLDDNTGFGIAVYQEGTELFVRQISKSCSCSDVTIQVPKGMKINVSHSNYNAENLRIKNVSSELEITTNHHDVRLEDVTGPMAVKTVYGSIDAIFTSLSQTGSVSLYSVYELVDVTIPSQSKMNVTLSAPYGSVYSNINVDVSDHGNGSWNSGTTIKGSFNGGGVEFSVKSAYEDVYLRQAN
ncbi:MAG: hypothetical protein P1U56_20790 [Saprospiraceae bacterium]|nr:hypothetical protein [Saprospiraceae bacterium]